MTNTAIEPTTTLDELLDVHETAVRARDGKRRDQSPGTSAGEAGRLPLVLPWHGEPDWDMPEGIVSHDVPFIEGTVEGITFRNDKTGFTVARLGVVSVVSSDKRKKRGRAVREIVTIKGTLPGIGVGESLRAWGGFVNDPKYGRQFKVERYEATAPATADGLRIYLAHLVKGVGSATADRIVDTFGAETGDIIEKEPERLGSEVPRLSRKLAAAIAQAWGEKKAEREVMPFLLSLGIGIGLANRIFKQFGSTSSSIVRNEPYRLLEVSGIGFPTADHIALGLSMPRDSIERAMAGVLHVLHEATNEGSTYLPRSELAKMAMAPEVLGLGGHMPPERVGSAIDRLTAEEHVRSEPVEGAEAIFTAPLYFAEANIAERIQRLLDDTDDRLSLSVETIQRIRAGYQPVGGERCPQGRLVAGSASTKPGDVPGPTGELTERQQEAVLSALTHKVTVITGGPGTGKTTTLRTLCELADAHDVSLALTAPTGRAAKRLSEATTHEASTIHRLLQLQPGGVAQLDEGNPIPADLVIVDEVSMLDVPLADALLRAIDPGSHLVLVGDVDQLPSVGPGNVLRDIIDSVTVPEVELDFTFRHSEDGSIAEAARDINGGEMPVFSSKGAPEGMFFFEKQNPGQAAGCVVDLVTNSIPKKFGLDPLRHIQVLSPMKNGEAGVKALNRRLQEVLNPPGPGKAEAPHGDLSFRVGDKVMQTVNNYAKNVFNGDAGFIESIDVEDKTLLVGFDGSGSPVRYDFRDLDELLHAFAITVHKSQGAEYPAVVVPILTQQRVMLRRNLLYTAVTRAQKLVVLVGTREAIGIAVGNNDTERRYSGLKRWLEEGWERSMERVAERVAERAS